MNTKQQMWSIVRQTIRRNATSPVRNKAEACNSDLLNNRKYMDLWSSLSDENKRAMRVQVPAELRRAFQSP